MASDETSERVLGEIKAELAVTPYRFTSAHLLTGGTANFIYQAKLEQPLPNGTIEVAIKHGEGFVRQSPNFKLTTSRCRVEESCLKYLESFPPHIGSKVSVGTPKLFYFNEKTNTQVQEYQPDPLSLKLYALKFYHSASSEETKDQCLEIGYGVGKWLREFHSWSNSPDQVKLREIAAANKDLQSIKHWLNYQQLPSAIERHPSVFGECADVFADILDKSAKELENEKNLQVIHGDFWTGNVLLRGQPWTSGHIRLFVVDWEMFQLALAPFDLGQMIAELYELKLFKDIDAGLWLIQGFVKGYGAVDDDFAFKTLLQVGVHLVSIGTTVQGWGTAEQVESVAIAGKDILLNAWSKQREWFNNHPLGCILSRN
ncbi:phosphotransferase enzyme family protein [Colletotrichum truncatum]|uniref:Phosphotransferase enzyme family protein n=1 Tax=Colletotrichum truncatum TaxID=5467 RepID=A0ACC3YG12_COLTU